MKHLASKICISVLLIGLTLNSCKKEELVIKDAPVAEADPSLAGTLPFPFAWETANTMPTPAGTTILVPWASGSNQQFDPALAYDFKAFDGWELVYNVFNTTSISSPMFFMLYNRYRGMLRVYLYLPPSPATPSTYINHGLKLSGSGNSSMLNFISQDVVDAGIKVAATTQTEMYQLQATGGWHVFQYEIAYDPGIASTSYQTLNFVCNTQSYNITQFNLYGKITGTLTGTIGQTAAAPSISLPGTATSIIKGVLSGVSTAGVTAALTGVDAVIKTAADKALEKGLTGFVENVFNAVFGGGSGGVQQQVNIKLNADIGLQGTSVTSSGLGNFTLAIPGSSNSINAAGYSPGYDKIMGVMNLSAKPKIRSQDVTINGGFGIGYGALAVGHRHSYSIDNSSYSVLFNPAVINGTATGAQIQNLKQEIVLFNAGYPSWGQPFLTDGLKEQVGSTIVFTNPTYSIQHQVSYGPSTPFNQTHGKLAIRVSFDVVPNNGATKLKVVKTFLATEVFI
jgi:hypothetical protein